MSTGLPITATIFAQVIWQMNQTHRASHVPGARVWMALCTPSHLSLMGVCSLPPRVTRCTPWTHVPDRCSGIRTLAVLFQAHSFLAGILIHLGSLARRFTIRELAWSSRLQRLVDPPTCWWALISTRVRCG